MAEERRPEPSEVKIGPDGVVVSGSAYEDFRPLFKTGVGAVEPLLRFVGLLVGIPADLASRHLERVRAKYSAKLEAIPPESRQPPPLRIGCGVLQKAVTSGDDDELQEMFANLLATGSDTRTASLAHPAFATVIAELQPVEARVLSTIAEKDIENHFIQTLKLKVDGDPRNGPGAFKNGIPNLVRLGLIEWLLGKASDATRFSFRSQLGSSPWLNDNNPRDISKVLRGFQDDVRRAFEEQDRVRGIGLTDFGERFMKACKPGK